MYKRIRLAIGGAIMGTCFVGFIGGYTGEQWQPWAGAIAGFILLFWFVGDQRSKCPTSPNNNDAK
jgi:hypothetical protein